MGTRNSDGPDLSWLNHSFGNHVPHFAPARQCSLDLEEAEMRDQADMAERGRRLTRFKLATQGKQWVHGTDRWLLLGPEDPEFKRRQLRNEKARRAREWSGAT